MIETGFVSGRVASSGPLAGAAVAAAAAAVAA